MTMKWLLGIVAVLVCVNIYVTFTALTHVAMIENVLIQILGTAPGQDS